MAERGFFRPGFEWDRNDVVYLRGRVTTPPISVPETPGQTERQVAETSLDIAIGGHTEPLRTVFPASLVESAAVLQAGEEVIVTGNLNTAFRADRTGYPRVTRPQVLTAYFVTQAPPSGK